MKILICSDIHGDFDSAKFVIDKANEINADKILILGDVLYHGPRNDLPKGYAPKRVIELLNEYSSKILCVRGNCDTEVDQMVLSFPILADYALLGLDGITVFATHGHKFNTDSVPPLSAGDILLHGHTHVLKIEEFGNRNYYINPGSVSIPKNSNPKTFAIYENKNFSIYDMEMNLVDNISL